MRHEVCHRGFFQPQLRHLISISIFLDSTFMQQTLSSGYPRLLRLFHEFFAKIAVQTDTTYTQEKQRCLVVCSQPRTPEAENFIAARKPSSFFERFPYLNKHTYNGLRIG